MNAGYNRNVTRLLLVGLITFYILSVLINLGAYNLQGEEPRRAVVSIEMLTTGDYIVPHALGQEYYNKPPLFNWILTGWIYITGSVSEFVLRIPSLIFLLLWAAVHYKVSRRFFSQESALLSAFFLLTVPDIFFYGLANGAEIDIFYSFIVYLQVVSLFWFYQTRNFWSLFIFSWLWCAAGFLTKGFPSIIFQGMTLVALCVHARSVRFIFKPAHLAGLAVFALVTGIYFYAYSTRAPLPVFLTNLVNESLFKWNPGEKRAAAGLQSLIVYPVSLLKLLAPWSLLLPILIWKRRVRFTSNPLVRFSVLFILFNIWVYWFAGTSKLRYVYVIVPFAMNIIIAAYDEFASNHPRLLDRLLKYGAILFVLVMLGLFALPFFYSEFVVSALLSGLIMAFFLFIFFKPKFQSCRIWLFVFGLVLVRLIYATVGVPIQRKTMFNYEVEAARLYQQTKGEELTYYLPADSLKLDIVLFDTLYHWPYEPVRVAPSLYHQWPYYYYRASGKILKYDSQIHPGRLYMSTGKHLKDLSIQPLMIISNKGTRDTLALFRQ